LKYLLKYKLIIDLIEIPFKYQSGNNSFIGALLPKCYTIPDAKLILVVALLKVMGESYAQLKAVIPLLINEGSLSNAAKAIVSNGVWPRTPEVLAELQALYPDRDPSPARPLEPAINPYVVACEDVLNAVKSFDKGAAAGPSGLPTLQCGASEVEDNLLRALADFCNFCVAGKLPSETASILLAATLYPFKKNHSPQVSGGVRPIAAGDTLRRLIAKCVFI